MTSSITFETAALADVIKKAAKVAPSKGAAFDKAAGIVIEFDPASSIPLAVVRATNLDIFMMEWVTVTESSGEAARWRLPASLLALVVGSLPIGTGKTVTLATVESGLNWVVMLTSGRTKVKLYPMDVEYYPEWGAFDPDDMYPAQDLGGRIGLVEWAASKQDPTMAGVYLDGQWALATDRYKMVRVPLKIPSLEAPIIVPSEVLGQILRETGEIQIGKSKEDNLLRIMPDDHTQMKAVLYDVKFPPIQKVMERDLPHRIKVNRDALLEVMQRINGFGAQGGDRVTGFQMFLGLEEIAFYMEAEQIGSIGDVLAVPGECTHERVSWTFTPKNIIDSVAKAPSSSIELCYNMVEKRYPLKVDDGAGYECWVMPRTVNSGEAS